MKREGSTTVVYAALGGNLAIAVTKFGAALYTGSSAMFTEALHSLVDTVDQGLLLYGMHRVRRPPDEAHPFGYGLELYFWSFGVALLIFSLGEAFAIYEGIEKFRHPEPIRDAWVNFTMLGLDVLFEGYSFGIAWREMRRRHADVGMWSALRRSKDPTTFTVILEDGAALTGLGVAAIGIAVSVRFDEPRADGVAPFAIGVLLVGVAVVLARETRSLLIGEGASAAVLARARDCVGRDERIARIQERGDAFDAAYGRLKSALPSLTYIYLMPSRGGP
jgi:cation diffusion facilitator family transporter